MDLLDLDGLIYNLGVDATDEQLEELLDSFKGDFEQTDFYVGDAKMKVIWTASREEGWEEYPETFVHLITRLSKSRKRVFDKHRANKIHWVKCILENKDAPEITFFQYPDKKDDIRDYYWFREGDFLVIIKEILPDCMIVTSFHIDDERNRKYYETRYRWYLENLA